MKEVRWERMFWDQLEAAIEECPVVYFAYGLCEPHGPQNALGLDILKAHGICCEAARTNGGIVAPPDYWHIHEHHGEAAWMARSIGETRSWATAVPAWHHFKSVAYHIRAAHQHGFHAALFVTGHYGPNWKDLKTLLEVYQPHVAPRLYGLPDFEANQPGFDNNGKSGGDHAGKVETSLLWALMPGCVDVSRIPDKDPVAPEERFAMGRNAREADRQTGERMVQDEVHWLGEKAKDLLAEYDKVKPDRKPLTFEGIDRIWDEEVKPRMKDFEICQPLFGDVRPPAENSRWRPHWDIPVRG
ncbi:MAG: creatininase family protein [Planctomycetes bacterium]|nr:creatininase family protein [Planctomycetota bacterium]